MSGTGCILNDRLAPALLQAEGIKDRGNTLFKEGDFEGAVDPRLGRTAASCH
jgi:hypothetical protein